MSIATDVKVRQTAERVDAIEKLCEEFKARIAELEQKQIVRASISQRKQQDQRI